MISRAQKVRLGLFVVVCAIALIALLVGVLGSVLWAERDSYTVHYDISVSGLEIGAPVKYNGVRMGRVESITIDPKQVSRTVVTLSLQSRTPIKENTRAILNVQGITGLRFIELVGGTSDAPIKERGGEILPGTSVVDKLTGQAENLTGQAELLIAQLLDLTGDKNREQVAGILDKSNKVLADLDRLVVESHTSLKNLLEVLSVASSALPPTLEEIRRAAQDTQVAMDTIKLTTQKSLDPGKINALIVESRAAVEELKRRVSVAELGKILLGIDGVFSRANELLGKMGMLVDRNREDIRASLRELVETAENLKDFSRLIREDPSLILRSQQRSERALP